LILSHLQEIDQRKTEKVDEKGLSQDLAPALTRVKDRSDSITAVGLNVNATNASDISEKEGKTNDANTSQLEALIQSEVLMDEDNADRPSYLFMYEQVGRCQVLTDCD